MDILTDPSVRGYVIGASNILFKQKKNLADVIVEVVFYYLSWLIPYINIFIKHFYFRLMKEK